MLPSVKRLPEHRVQATNSMSSLPVHNTSLTAIGGPASKDTVRMLGFNTETCKELKMQHRVRKGSEKDVSAIVLHRQTSV